MLRGLNHRREDYGLQPIRRDQVFDYRDNYIKTHYSYDERVNLIDKYLANHLMNSQRNKGILLFGCRFGSRYMKAFRSLIGKDQFNKLSEQHRVSKMVSTQSENYGGVGLASDSSLLHARQTNIERYGVLNPMQDKKIKNTLFANMLDNIGQGMEKYRVSHNIKDVEDVTFNGSPVELFVLSLLCDRFGYNDVYYQYGMHPHDKRYPYNCDFYIKSLDLFIELNYYYAHGGHWFDRNSVKDMNKLVSLEQRKSKSDAYTRMIKTWTKSDVEKRLIAKKNSLNYLVFWKYPVGNVKDLKLSDLSDLYEWLVHYSGDFKRFLKDHPENTY